MTVLVLITGAILHFTYKWSGKNPFVGTFSAVNESTWEHLKITFFPMILFGIIFYSSIKAFSNNYIEGLTIGILTAFVFIVVFFYGYQFILGNNNHFFNILDYVLGVILGEFIFYKVVTINSFSNYYTKLVSSCILLLFACLFVVFTFYPPDCFLFISPV